MWILSISDRMCRRRQHWAYVPAAGIVRCYLSGYSVASVVRLLKVPPRPGFNALCDRPAALGGALASFCLIFHTVRLGLAWIDAPRHPTRRAALAGAVAASALASRRADVAGPHTELHATVIVTVVRTVLPAWARGSHPHDGKTHKSRLKRCFLGTVPIAIACAATWQLLVLQPSPSTLDAQPPLLLAATFGRSLRSGAAAQLRATGPSTVLLGAKVIHQLLLSPRHERRGIRAEGAVQGAVSAVAAESGTERAAEVGTEETAHLAARAAAFATTRALLRLALSQLTEAVALGTLSGVIGTLTAAGGGACRQFGWSAGLAVLPLPASRQADVSARLAFQALYRTVEVAPRLVRQPTSLTAVPVETVSPCAVSSLCASCGGEGVRMLGAVVLGACAARLLEQHALYASLFEQAPAGAHAGLRLSSHALRTMHFLLGYDESEARGVGD